jgi:hypothetical protein
MVLMVSMVAGCLPIIMSSTLFGRGCGLLGDIVSDRDTRFTSGFYRELCHKLGIHQSMSTAWHPQFDGSTEVVNKVVETTIRAHVNHMQTNWCQLLCMVEFAINNSKHSATRFTPFL